MGTANFHNKNASVIFVANVEEEMDYYDLFDNLRYMLKDKEFYTYRQKNAPTPKSYNRSCPARIVGDKTEYTYYGDAEVIITIKAVIRSGYYQHCNLDWEIDASVGGYEINEMLNLYCYGSRITFEDALSDWMNEGMAKIHAPSVKNWMHNTKDDLVYELEKVYELITDQYVCTARASNGEAMYEKV